jgi:hypothetical protein
MQTHNCPSSWSARGVRPACRNSTRHNSDEPGDWVARVGGAQRRAFERMARDVRPFRACHSAVLLSCAWDMPITVGFPAFVAAGRVVAQSSDDGDSKPMLPFKTPSTRRDLASWRRIIRSPRCLDLHRPFSGWVAKCSTATYFFGITASVTRCSRRSDTTKRLKRTGPDLNYGRLP